MTLKKMFLLVFALAILLPVATNATVSRYYGLGGPGTDYIVYDAANPSIYPSLTTKWVKLFGVEYAGTDAGWDHTLVYGVWDFGEGKSAIKFILDSSPTSTFDVGLAGVFEEPANVDGNYHQLNMQYARPMGDVSIGLGLRMEGKAYDSNGEMMDIEAKYASWGATFGLTAIEKKLDAAMAIDFADFSRVESGETIMKDHGSMQFSLQARFWHKYNDTSTLVPHFRLLNKEFGVRHSGRPNVTYTEATHDIILGLGHNWRPVENCLIIFELGVQSFGKDFKSKAGSVTMEGDDINRQDIYWRAGGETRITSWLWGRLGAARQWRDETDENSATTVSYTATTVYVGGTAHWQRLHMDFLIEPGFFKYGPAFIGGDNPDEDSGLTSRLSLRYQLDEGSWAK